MNCNTRKKTEKPRAMFAAAIERHWSKTNKLKKTKAARSSLPSPVKKFIGSIAQRLSGQNRVN